MMYGLEDDARLDYGRLLWKSPRGRRRLLYIWEHQDHPHRERFQQYRNLIVGLLECPDPKAYASQQKDWSLRMMSREIPAIIWSLWREAGRTGH